MTPSGSGWSGQLAFGPWWFLYSGPIGPTDMHAHHAFQIVVHAGGPCVADNHNTLAGPVVVIEPDEAHAFTDWRDHALVAFIDPESRTGADLAAHLVASPTTLGSDEPVSSIVGALHPENWSQAEEAMRRILVAVCDAPIERPSSWRHAAVDAALLRLPDLIEAGTVNVALLAEEVGLSVGRLTHVFSEEIGVPVSAYARWLRLTHAVEHLANGRTLTEAAHQAGFADGAHFSRTFRAMFGLSPSEAVGAGSWLSP